MMLKNIIMLFGQTYFSFPLNPLYWLVLILITLQYRRLQQNEKRLLGRGRHLLWEQVLASVLFGLVGGLIAGVILFVLGINLMEIGIIYVWPLALILAFVHPRYLCFAYAGGLVGAVAAIVQMLSGVLPFGPDSFLKGIHGIHVPGLIALIGTLHFAESILIALSGHLHPSPAYIKTDHGVVGAFVLQRFWPLPLVGIIAEVIPKATAETLAGTPMPDWWPLFASKIIVEAGFTLAYFIFPIVAGLGFGDLAVSTSPREKAKRSALHLGLYSLLVILLAFIANGHPALTLLAALFVPLGHELIIQLGIKRELEGEPKFKAPAYGVKVLDLFADSAAKAAGMLPGDIITNINGIPIENFFAFQAVLRSTWRPLQVLVERGGQSRLLIIDCQHDPGIIVVPDRFTTVYMQIKQVRFWEALQQKIKNLLKRNRFFRR
ncbi:MAG: PDZ domain-containing protein [Firmicutes bacterium]|nr:PDZ domain-containing protein [Bacillota bacterium]